MVKELRGLMQEKEGQVRRLEREKDRIKLENEVLSNSLKLRGAQGQTERKEINKRFEQAE